MFSNQQIKEGIISGNNIILNHIYKEYRQKVIRTITKSGGTDYEAKDIFQTVLVRLYHRLITKSTEVSNFENYLMRASIYEHRKSMKEQNRFFSNPASDYLTKIDKLHSESINFEHEDADEDFIVHFLKTFNLLPEHCKSIFKHKADGLTYKEMSKYMNNASEGLLRVKKHNCQELFYKLYNE